MSLAFLVPGALDQLTGGYLFDRQVVDGLRALGRAVTVIELAGRHPDPDEQALAGAVQALGRLPDGSAAVIDGLALPAFAGCLAEHAARLRLLAFVHHPLSLETGLSPCDARRYAALESRLWPLMRGVLCPSAHTARAVIEAGVAPDRVAVTPPGTRRPQGVINPVQTPVQTPVRQSLNLLAVGTVTQRKGHRLLIEALAGLADHAWQLACVGSLERDTACVASLRAQIDALGLGDRVVLAGEQSPDALEQFWRRADLFVLPSYHEGYGMAYAEALVRGLPVIATRAGAIPDTVPSGAGLLVPPGDADALREALRQMFSDTPLRLRLAAGARQASTSMPDWPAAVRRWAGECDRLIA
mgnify:CR=1 FL=1|jgi:glycosyltransferase involved in cell wall biosynthesis